jgi:RNA polymerase sigma factor (sigma-70 family)
MAEEQNQNSEPTAEETYAELSRLSAEIVGKLLAPLDEREQRILRQRLGLDGSGEIRKLEDIGAELNLPRERVRQIEARAMTKLRHGLTNIEARDLL